ncbi:unnamed protein product [Effrenium voratum]|nr:unnamed protein product [Effrenium voratum]
MCDPDETRITKENAVNLCRNESTAEDWRKAFFLPRLASLVTCARWQMSRLRVAAAALVLSVRSVAGSCEEVWFEEGEFGIEREAFTCGERIVYLQSPQGGLLTEQEARVQTALENDECADCWPWEKYRQDGETDRSSKRGIAIESSLLTAESLSTLGKTISWGATWGYKITDGPDLSVWEMAGVDFIPMVWGHGTIPLAEADGLPKGSKALLGFNEPNFPDQANLDPYWAAQHWPDVEKLAAANNISYIVSPALNYHWSFDPIDWLYQFFAICEGCKVDAVALHVFSCYAAGLKYHLDRYRVFGKPLWVTEIACSDPASPERLSAEGQMAYMKEAIPLLEADDDVEMYAWFSYFKDEWAHPIVNGENGDAGIVFPNGTLSPLGELYNSFAAGSNKTEINITMPEWKNETVSTTATSETVATSIATTSTSSATDTATLTLSSVTSTITATFATATGTSTSATSTRTSATLTATETTVTATQTATTATTTQTTVTATSTETSITSADTGTSTASSTVSSTLTSSATDTVTSSSTLTTTKTTVTVTATSSTATWSGITSTRTATTWTATTQTSTRSTTQTGTATLTAAQTGTSTLSQIITMTTSQTGTSTATATQSSTATTTQTGTSTLTRTLSGTSTATASQTGTSTLGSTEATTSTSASANGTATATLTVTKVSALSATSTTESTSTATSSSTAKKESTTPEPQRKYTTRHLTGTAPSTTLTQGESTTSTEPEYDDEDNSTNDTDSEIDFLSCTEAVESWCQADPSADAPFYPLRHCADWRLHDAMCTSSAPIAAQPAFAGLEMPSGNFPAAFLFVAMGASAMTGAVLASLYNKQKCCLPLCCRRKTRAEEEQEALKRAASGKKCEWQGTCMPVMGKHGSAATARVAPDPGVFLPEEAVARRVAFSPQNAKNAPCEGSPMMASLSKASNWNEIAVGTPVGTTPASRAAALTMLADAISKATAEDTSLEEKQSWLDQAGRLLSGGAAMNLPMNVRQEAESWQSRQEDRLRLAKSMEEVVNRAASLQNAAEETSAPDPLKGLLSRVKRDEEGNREAMLAEAARRASAFQEELDSQRLKLKARRKGDKSILDAADLIEQKQELADMQQKVVQEMSKLQEWKGEPAVGDNDCVGACNALEEAWKQFAVNLEGMSEEALAALHAATETKTAKVFSSDAERQAALAEAARRQALFQEELQKQRHKLQKRSKAKTAAPAPVEFGRLLEDQAALQALEVEREAAMEECQRYIGDARAYGNSAEENKWIDVLQGWHGVEEDLPQLSTNELPEGTWSAMASRAKTGKVSVDHDEQLALLAEAARRAAAFDEELQKQRSHMKKRRKALQKGELEQADPLEACRTLADEEVLKRLAKEQADACAQCEAMAAIGDGVAWEELGAAWAQMQTKDISKAEKERPERLPKL